MFPKKFQVVLEGVFQQFPEPNDFRKICLLERLIYSGLQKIVAQNKLGIDLIHFDFSFLRVFILPLNQTLV